MDETAVLYAATGELTEATNVLANASPAWVSDAQ